MTDRTNIVELSALGKNVPVLHGYDRIAKKLLEKGFAHVQWVEQEHVKGETRDADAPAIYCTRHGIYENGALAKYEYQRESEPGEVLYDDSWDRFPQLHEIYAW